jgi:hypothetical protein
MLWFTIHHLVQNIVSAEDQTKNLITFLSGTVIYTLFYSYLSSFDFSVHLFLRGLFNFFGYVILADAFAMAIIYKNYYKQTIFTEVKETMGSNLPFALADDKKTRIQ